MHRENLRWGDGGGGGGDDDDNVYLYSTQHNLTKWSMR